MQVAPPGMAPCALGSLVEVLVNATGAPRSEDILVTAYSPTGRSLKCPLKKVKICFLLYSNVNEFKNLYFDFAD